MSASQTDASGFSQPHQLHSQTPYGGGVPFDQHSGSNASAAEHYRRLAQEQGSSSYSSQSRIQQQKQQQQKSPTLLAHANPTGNTVAGSPPMEQKQRPAGIAPTGYSPAGDGMAERNYRHPRQEMAQGAAGTTMKYIDANKDSPARTADTSSAFSTSAAVSVSNAHDGHVTGAGSTGVGGTTTHSSEPGYGNYPPHSQIAETSAVNTHLLAQEMQEQRQSPSEAATTPSTRPTTARRADPEPGAGAAVATATSAITIQSLLNSPLEEPAGSLGTARGRRSIDATSEPSTISEHIAKENARFRQNSNASSHLPAILPRVQQQQQQQQQPPTPTAAPQDSGPDSQSSYHSAGYSMWNGYAETINQDFTTAQQSLSSMDGPGLGVSMPPVDSGSGISAEHSVSVAHAAGYSATTEAASASASAMSASRGASLGPALYPHPVPVPVIPASLVASMAAVGAASTSVSDVLTDTFSTRDADSAGVAQQQGGLEICRPHESLPRGEREFDYAFYNSLERKLKKPVSIMVQVGDDSLAGSDDGSYLSQMHDSGGAEDDAATPAAVFEQNDNDLATGRDSPHLSERSDDVGSMSSFGDNPFTSTRHPRRKATMESLDNVLEYYRTHPGTGSPSAIVEASSAETMSSVELPFVQPFPSLVSDTEKTTTAPPVPSRNPFESLKDSQYRPQLGSSRAPVRDANTSPIYQRTSFSSPVVEPLSRRKYTVDSELRPLPHADRAASPGAEASDPTPRDSDSVRGNAQSDPESDDRQPLLSADKRAGSGAQIPAAPTAALPDRSTNGSHMHSREATPIETSAEGSAGNGTPDGDSSLGMRANEHLSARRWHVDVPTADLVPKEWTPHQPPPPRYQDIYDNLEDPSDLDELVLPPTSAAVNLAQKASKDLRPIAKYSQELFSVGKSVLENLEDSDEDCIVQMESIDGISELSDMMDIATTHDSDFGYSHSNSSTDSFGEPIEHETGILSKSLAVPSQSQLRQRVAATATAATRRGAGEDMIDLGSGFSRITLAPMTIHQLNGSAFAPPVPPSALQRYAQSRLGAATQAGVNADRHGADQILRDALHSGRTNTSTLTTSTALGDNIMPDASVEAEATAQTAAAGANTVATTATAAVAAVGASVTGNQGRADKALQDADETTTTSVPVATGTTIAASEPVKQADNSAPLEIMEHASELEISLAREQEDYFSDNVSPANLDPVILQNLGKAVHHQCLLQRQHQLQRRKSNMHLGLGTGGAEGDHGHSAETTIVEPQYDDYEQALRAMLVEVSQYFTQSGLCFVFPFSAKWVEWLTRHPDRPFPWRKDSEDDDELGVGRGRRGHGRDGENGDEGEFSDAQSDVSSFSEELLVLSRPLPPEDVLAKATIPMSTRRPVLVKDFVSQEKRKGINAHWQYYSVINQIVAVASGIHRKLLIPAAEADHAFVAHQLAALYQFLGGEFKKYKPHIESVFDVVKQSLADSVVDESDGKAKDGDSANDSGDGEVSGKEPNARTEGARRRVLDRECAHVLREMMASIITDALYSTSKIVLAKEQAMPSSPTGGGAVRTKQQTQQDQQQTQAQQGQGQEQVVQQPQTQTSKEASLAISTLKGLPTQPIVR
ncbi:hypothetical protein EV175_004384, partial [Coemansia sp. RSA 1933]